MEYVLGVFTGVGTSLLASYIFWLMMTENGRSTISRVKNRLLYWLGILKGLEGEKEILQFSLKEMEALKYDNSLLIGRCADLLGVLIHRLIPVVFGMFIFIYLTILLHSSSLNAQILSSITLLISEYPHKVIIIIGGCFIFFLLGFASTWITIPALKLMHLGGEMYNYEETRDRYQNRIKKIEEEISRLEKLKK